MYDTGIYVNIKSNKPGNFRACFDLMEQQTFLCFHSVFRNPLKHFGGPSPNLTSSLWSNLNNLHFKKIKLLIVRYLWIHMQF